MAITTTSLGGTSSGDIITLGIRIQADGADQVGRELDRVAGAGGRAEQSAARLGQVSRSLNQVLEQQSKIIANGRTGMEHISIVHRDFAAATAKSHVSAGRLNQELLTLIRNMTGLNPIVTQATGMLGQMTLSGKLMTGVLLGLGATATLYHLIGREAREASARTNELVTSLREAARQRDAGGDAGLLASRRGSVSSEIAAIESAQRSRPMFGSEASAAEDAWFAARLAYLKHKYANLGDAVAELETQLEQKRLEAMHTIELRRAYDVASAGIESGRRSAIAAHFGASPEVMSEVNRQFDIAAAKAKNHADMLQAMYDNAGVLNEQLVAMILNEEKRKNALVEATAAEARANDELQRRRRIMQEIDAGSVAARNVAGLATPQNATWISSRGEYVPVSAPARQGFNFYSRVTGDPYDLMHGGFYAPDPSTLRPLNLAPRYPGTRYGSATISASDFNAPTWLDSLKNASNFNKGMYAAQAVGGVVLGTGIAGNGAVSAGLSGALSMAASGAMIAGPVGAVVGAVGGLVSGLIGHSKKVREEEERLKEAQRGFNLSLDARLAAARGDTERAEQLERMARYEKELADARKAGMSAASIKVLEMVQAEEKLAAERERAKKAAEEAAEAERRRTEATKDLIVRGLTASGQDYWASKVGLMVSQRRERYDAEQDKMGPEFLAFMDFVHGIEMKSLELNESVRLQTETIQNTANATLSVLDQQLQTAQMTAQIQQEQLRNQEATVSALRNVVDSLTGYSNELKVGSLSTLSPIQQLTSARTQFEGLYSLAAGGDLSAAQSIRGAGNTLLSLSRGYSASGSGFVSDFNRVQSAVDALLNKYGTQLPVEERILAELQNQTAQTNVLIQQLGTQIETVRAEAQRQIDAINAQAAADRASWSAALLEWANANDWLHDIFGSLDLLPGKLNEIKGYPPILNTGVEPYEVGIRDATVNTAMYTQQGFASTVDELQGLRSELAGLREDMLYRYGP